MRLTDEILKSKYGVIERALKIGREAQAQCASAFSQIEETTEFNQLKVLEAFRQCRLAPNHFSPSYGYGYSDAGREKLEELFALVFNAPKAIVRPQIASGTHALALTLYGLLGRGDKLIYASGRPYDTLEEIIGASEESKGSLKELGVEFEAIPCENGLEYELIGQICAEQKPALVAFQRSRGYALRPSLCCGQLKKAFEIVRAASPESIIMVDNCYGEFVEECEPIELGADIIAGSLIKNPGGGLAPTGGYIAGRADLIERIGYRLTSPGIGLEVGSYAASYLPFFQGLFLAPHVVGQALKGAVFASNVYSRLGYRVSPLPGEKRGCIIQSLGFNTAQELIAFCQDVQRVSPVESHVLPEPWDMPGYQDQVIMAAGAFIQGASIELSADAPIRPPYTAYMQGGLVWEQVKAAVLKHISGLKAD